MRRVARLDSSRVDEAQLLPLPPAEADGQHFDAELYSIPKEEEKAKLLAKASALAAEVVDERSAIAAHSKPKRKRRAATEKPESVDSGFSAHFLESNDTCSTVSTRKV